MSCCRDEEGNLSGQQCAKAACGTGCKQTGWAVGLITTLLFLVGVVAHFSVPKEIVKTCGGQLEFTAAESAALKGIIIVTSVLSLAGSAFIIFSYYYFVNLRSFPYKLIMFLSVADFFSSLTYIIGAGNDANECYEGNFMCYFSAGMSQFFDVASFLWMAVISFNIYQVLGRRRGHDVVFFEPYYHLFAWGTSGVLLLIITATNSLGDAGNWCWVRRDRQIERMLCYYVILIIIMIYAIVMYFLVRNAVKTQNMSQQNMIMARMRLYVIIFLFIRFWSVLNRMVELFDGNKSIFVFMFFHSLFSPLQGFANAFVYGLNAKLKKEIRKTCPCFRDPAEDEALDMNDDNGDKLELQPTNEAPPRSVM